MALIKCNECGKEISDKAKVCIHCGCPIEEKIKCEECGKELKSDDTVCTGCGCPIEKLIKCEECGKELKHNDTICSDCGCPVENTEVEETDNKESKTTNNSDASIFIKIGGIIGICLLALALVVMLKDDKNNIDKNNLNKPNIVGRWTHKEVNQGVFSCERKLTIEDDTHATIKEIYINSYGNKTIKEDDCTYEFRNNYTEIKLSCGNTFWSYGETVNEWVNFEKERDAIYINNYKYVSTQDIT